MDYDNLSVQKSDILCTALVARWLKVCTVLYKGGRQSFYRIVCWTSCQIQASQSPFPSCKAPVYLRTCITQSPYLEDSDTVFVFTCSCIRRRPARSPANIAFRTVSNPRRINLPDKDGYPNTSLSLFGGRGACHITVSRSSILAS